MTPILVFLKASDKQRHFEVCFGLTMALGYLLMLPLSLLVAVAIAALAVLAIGFCKEVYDKQHPLTHTPPIGWIFWRMRLALRLLVSYYCHRSFIYNFAHNSVGTT